MADLGAAAAHAEIEDVAIDAAEEITRLAGLSELEYERERPQSAKVLQIRTSVLDRLVQKERRALGGDRRRQAGPETRAARYRALARSGERRRAVARYLRGDQALCRLGDHAALAVALWIVHAHALDAAEHTPRLHIASPEKRCGKTTLLGVIEPMLPRALNVENITTSALFRTIEAARPTLLLDEADSFLTTNEEMRGLLNAGHARGGTVVKAVGEDFEPRQFTVWAATVIAGIGRIPATIEDRSITIQLRRRVPGETVERLRLTRRRPHCRARPQGGPLGARPHRQPAGPRPGDAGQPFRPRPGQLETLIAIADTIGHGWGERARQAAVALDGDGSWRRAHCRRHAGQRCHGDIRGQSARAAQQRRHRPSPQRNGGPALAGMASRQADDTEQRVEAAQAVRHRTEEDTVP
jgi:putative DNA primase/helicase